MSTSLLARRFFEQHPEHKDGVMKAYYAYNIPHFRCDPKAHNFSGFRRESVCVWCGRSRELVRWDELPPECLSRPIIPEIEGVILGEERKAFALLAKAEKEVPKLAARLGISGETLAVLHHTYGYDPETVASNIDIPPNILDDYHCRMDEERALSRAAQVKAIL